mgnify:CR=1 FL=1
MVIEKNCEDVPFNYLRNIDLTGGGGGGGLTDIPNPLILNSLQSTSSASLTLRTLENPTNSNIEELEILASGNDPAGNEAPLTIRSSKISVVSANNNNKLDIEETDVTVSSNTGNVNITATTGDVSINSGGTQGTTISANNDCNVLSDTGKVIITATGGDVDINANDDAINLNSDWDINLTAESRINISSYETLQLESLDADVTITSNTSNTNILSETGNVFIKGNANVIEDSYKNYFVLLPKKRVKEIPGQGDPFLPLTNCGTGISNVTELNELIINSSYNIITNLQINIGGLIAKPIANNWTNNTPPDGFPTYTNCGIICNNGTSGNSEQWIYQIKHNGTNSDGQAVDVNGIINKIRILCVSSAVTTTSVDTNKYKIGIFASSSSSIDISGDLDSSKTTNTEILTTGIFPEVYFRTRRNYTNKYVDDNGVLVREGLNLDNIYLYLFYYSTNTDIDNKVFSDGKFIITLEGCSEEFNREVF